jgi:hypothetical protein
MKTSPVLPTPKSDPTTDTPRARRGAAAVIAQYIQDLSRPLGPSSPLSRTAAA